MTRAEARIVGLGVVYALQEQADKAGPTYAPCLRDDIEDNKHWMADVIADMLVPKETP